MHMPRHTDEFDFLLSPYIKPHNNLSNHAVLNAPLSQPYANIRPRCEVFTPKHVHTNSVPLEAVEPRNNRLMDLGNDTQPFTCTECDCYPNTQCASHSISDVIPNASLINSKDDGIAPPSPEQSRCVDHRLSPGLISGSSIAPASLAWQAPSGRQRDTVAHARWVYGTPTDDVTLGAIVQDYDVPYENDVIVETDDTYYDTMNALTNTYEQHLTFNEPQHSCTSCHINFPTKNDLENHSLIHESYYNPLLGHSYTEEPNHCNYSFTYFNVCGLSSKLFFDDFKETLIKHDIISLCETKLDDVDNDYIIDEFKKLGFGVFIKKQKKIYHLEVRRRAIGN